MSHALPTISFLAAVPQFTVPDLVRTVEYYRDVLGFQMAGYWDAERVSLVGNASSVFAIVWRDQVQVSSTAPIRPMLARARPKIPQTLTSA